MSILIVSIIVISLYLSWATIKTFNIIKDDTRVIKKSFDSIHSEVDTYDSKFKTSTRRWPEILSIGPEFINSKESKLFISVYNESDVNSFAYLLCKPLYNKIHSLDCSKFDTYGFAKPFSWLLKVFNIYNRPNHILKTFLSECAGISHKELTEENLPKIIKALDGKNIGLLFLNINKRPDFFEQFAYISEHIKVIFTASSITNGIPEFLKKTLNHNHYHLSFIDPFQFSKFLEDCYPKINKQILNGSKNNKNSNIFNNHFRNLYSQTQGEINFLNLHKNFNINKDSNLNNSNLRKEVFYNIEQNSYRHISHLGKELLSYLKLIPFSLSKSQINKLLTGLEIPIEVLNELTMYGLVQEIPQISQLCLLREVRAFIDKFGYGKTATFFSTSEMNSTFQEEASDIDKRHLASWEILYEDSYEKHDSFNFYGAPFSSDSFDLLVNTCAKRRTHGEAGYVVPDIINNFLYEKDNPNQINQLSIELLDILKLEKNERVSNMQRLYDIFYELSLSVSLEKTDKEYAVDMFDHFNGELIKYHEHFNQLEYRDDLTLSTSKGDEPHFSILLNDLITRKCYADDFSISNMICAKHLSKIPWKLKCTVA